MVVVQSFWGVMSHGEEEAAAAEEEEEEEGEERERVMAGERGIMYFAHDAKHDDPSRGHGSPARRV
jgi:hypothetical protein